tara:strand:+ start:645 stop:2453 length:1809 start_codon:yes stop_codon:yes gene_type:complete
MEQLTPQGPEVQDTPLNVLVGSYQRAVPSVLEGAADGASILSKALADKKERSSKGAITNFDSGLANALAEQADPEFLKALEADAKKLDQAEQQNGQRSLRARRVAVARSYMEANPEQAATILNTFKLTTGEDLGSAQTELFEDFEAEKAQYEKLVLEEADELNVNMLNKDGTRRDIEQIASDVHFRREEINAQVRDVERATRMELLDKNRKKEVISAYTTLGYSLLDQGEGTFQKFYNELPKAVRDELSFVDAQQDPDLINRFLVQNENLVNNYKASMVAALQGQGTQAEIDLAFSGIEQRIDLQRQVLRGEIDKETYDARIAYLTAAARNVMYKQNPDLAPAVALAAEINQLLPNLTDADERRALIGPSGYLGQVMRAVDVNMKATSQVDGRSSDELYQDQIATLELLNSNNNFSDEQRMNMLTNLTRNVLPDVINDARLTKEYVKVIGHPEYAKRLKESLDAHPNPAARAQILNTIQRHYDRAINTIDIEIERISQEPIEVTKAQSRKITDRTMLSPWGLLRDKAITLDELFYEGAQFDDELYNSFTPEDRAKFDKARAELIEVIGKERQPLIDAMSQWNVIIKQSELPDLEKEEQEEAE